MQPNRKKEKNFLENKHFGIESENAGPSKCEECTIQKMGGAAAYTPSYMWNGQNYMMKLISDANSVVEGCEPLREYLGVFPMEENPLFLPKSIPAVRIALN